MDPKTGESTLASIPREFLPNLDRVAFDPSFGAGPPGFGRSATRKFLEQWEIQAGKMGLGGLRDGVFVLLVRDEERKREVEKMVEGMRERERRILRAEVG